MVASQQEDIQASYVASGDPVVPDKWRRLKKILSNNGWRVDHISGSHHIF